ncbi:MAG: DUF2586 domain-containing protein [Bacteroidetes bacterium]|nr:DUF2586 domain-containing protein [Bacteroidota bacterium]MCL2302912.1 DUF2586 domain-containing protein [Lentimicrobiaceae bacterium]
MSLNNITIIRQNGGVPATLPGEDHYSGLLVYLAAADMPQADAGVTGFGETNRIVQISTIEYAESLGIKPDSEKWILKALHYHLSEAFRINPAIMLWVGLFDKPTGNYDFVEIKQMQNYAEGKIRQIGVYAPENLLKADDLTTLQGNATNLEANDMPLSCLYCAKVGNIAILQSMAGIGQKNVSVLIGQAGSGVAKDLFDAGNGKCVGIVGNALGMLSKMAVHESIAWVAKCPTGVNLPAFADGTLLKSIDIGIVNTLNDKRFIFLRTFGGLQGSFYNDSHTMDEQTSDYNAIERVRTMDKACRGARTHLLPHLSSPLYVDPQSGKVDQGTVAFLTSVANRQLEAMEKAGELSGYVVEIDPNQNVLVSSELEFVMKNVPVGVLRKMRIKIGYTTKLE